MAESKYINLYYYLGLEDYAPKGQVLAMAMHVINRIDAATACGTDDSNANIHISDSAFANLPPLREFVTTVFKCARSDQWLKDYNRMLSDSVLNGDKLTKESEPFIDALLKANDVPVGFEARDGIRGCHRLSGEFQRREAREMVMAQKQKNACIIEENRARMMGNRGHSGSYSSR